MPNYDKKGREIRIGDTLKVFHFTGARKKKYYMYKYVQGVREYETHSLLVINHLSKKFDLKDTYHLLIDNKINLDIEIVQGFNNKNEELSFEDRPRISLVESRGEQA